MRARLIAILLALLPCAAAAHTPGFDADFTGETMRLGLYQVGDARDELVTLHEVHRDGQWAGPRSPLLDPFGYGRYAVTLLDAATRRPLYSRGFDTMFGEYRTTGPALEGKKRVFERAVRVPWPRRPVVLEVGRRNAQNLVRGNNPKVFAVERAVLAVIDGLKAVGRKHEHVLDLRKRDRVGFAAYLHQERPHHR